LQTHHRVVTINDTENYLAYARLADELNEKANKDQLAEGVSVQQIAKLFRRSQLRSQRRLKPHLTSEPVATVRWVPQTPHRPIATAMRNLDRALGALLNEAKLAPCKT
jgi:hypothetical protein